MRGIADAAWYDAAYKAIDGYSAPYWESHYYYLWTVIADRVRQAGARAVVDIGCGPGQLAACLFGLAGIERYTGLDYSAHAIEMAKQACPQGQFLVGDATTTDIHAQPHDLLICTEVLEHVPDDDRVIDRFRPGVRCLCSVPNFPYDSHVRHFRTAAEVEDRYARWFDGLDVWPVRGSEHNILFLIDGKRNTTRRAEI